MMQRGTVLQVVGHAWQGFAACMEYPTTETPKTRAEAAKLAADVLKRPTKYAGDFQDVSDVRIVVHSHEWGTPAAGVEVHTHTARTLRGFRSGMTPRRFSRIVNGC